jgi:hypothetical protein
MYADDMGALAHSPSALQTLIDSIHAALTKWRLKASVKAGDGSKTAVMVVKSGSRQPQANHTWTWGDVPIPQVASYKYLGAWVSQTGQWTEHITKRMLKADAAANAQHKIMQQTKLPWYLRNLTMTAVVQPVLTYACQVWSRSTCILRKQLDSWQLHQYRRMTHCPPTTSAICLQQELGITPLHMACDMWTLAYWHHLRCLHTDRLLQRVYTAWQGAANPWQKHVNNIITEYNLDVEATKEFSKAKFKRHVKTLITNKLHSMWLDTTSRANNSVHTRYLEAFGCGHTVNGVNGLHPTARHYISSLSLSGRGRPAELCMQLRLECLPLRCMHAKHRSGESVTMQQHRQCCASCKNADETASHFLLECPAYTDVRQLFFAALDECCPGMLDVVRSSPVAWRRLIDDSVIGQKVAVVENEQQKINKKKKMAAVAEYMIAAWKLRSAALTGRGTNGGDPVV